MKKISLRNVSDILSDNELKHLVGGQEAPVAECFRCCTNSGCSVNTQTWACGVIAEMMCTYGWACGPCGML